MNALRRFFASMAGRVFTILALGMVGAALLGSLLIAARGRLVLEQQDLERTVDRIEDFVAVLEAAPATLRQSMLAGELPPGIRLQPANLQGQWTDEPFSHALQRRGGSLTQARAQEAAVDVCVLSPSSRATLEQALQDTSVRRALERARERNGGNPQSGPPSCHLIDLRLADGTPLRVSVASGPVEPAPSLLTDPLFLLWFGASLVLLAYLVSRIATAPLRRLVIAADDLGRDLQRPALPLSGPLEVRHAAAAFNSMQQQLQQHLTERTQMLAAITHDLQTPLTRMRLRLEGVPDEAVRARLVDDVNAMKALIDEGLELARSTDTHEPIAAVDLDSLLEAVVEDAVDAGGDARLEQRSGAVLPLRPLAAQRMVVNLVDNAIKYGGCAIIAAGREGNQVTVTVRDTGPGVPPELLAQVFQPFFRVEGSRSRATGGVGLGLTVARMLAERNGATLQLRNHPAGGLECELRWQLAAAAQG